jgi:uncharacterized protein (TIGR03083 family)
MTEKHIEALRASVARLRDIAAQLSDEDLARQAYPEEWTIAQVFSHLGSGAVIMQRSLEDVVAGRETPEDHAPSVWDTWNAKAPAEQRTDALAADAALLERIEATPPQERTDFAMSMGPRQLGFTDFVASRLNEHAFHTWDIEVVGDPQASIPEQSAELVVDNLELVARFTAKPTGDTADVTVATANPVRGFVVELTPDSAVLTSRPSRGEADLELPAEAFARLVYGRLPPERTPSGVQGDAVELLRRVFPGP